MLELIENFLNSTGIVNFFTGDGWMNLIMIFIGIVFLYLAIKKGFEPYLLIPIAIGMILVNIFPNVYIDYNMYDKTGQIIGTYTDLAEIPSHQRGLLGVLHLGVEYELYPCLIFIGIGATTDFGPLIANKKTMLLGAAAQIGIFAAGLILGPFIESACKRGYARMLCEFEKDYTFTTTAGRQLSGLFRFKK